MTRIETARVNEVIGLQIASIKEAAGRLSADSDLQELEAGISALETTIAELKYSLSGIPFKHS